MEVFHVPELRDAFRYIRWRDVGFRGWVEWEARTKGNGPISIYEQTSGEKQSDVRNESEYPIRFERTEPPCDRCSPIVRDDEYFGDFEVGE